MANTIIAKLDLLTIQTGQTAGNEVIIKTDPRYTSAVEVINEAAGSAQLFCSIDPNYDPVTNGFTGMTPDDSGIQSGNFNRQVQSPVGWIGVKISSGTWTIKIHQRKQALVG